MRRDQRQPKITFVRGYYATRKSAVRVALDELGLELARRGYEVEVLAIPGAQEEVPLKQARLPIAAAFRRLDPDSGVAKALFLCAALIYFARPGLACDYVVTVDTPPGVGLIGRVARLLGRGKTIHVSWILDLFYLQRLITNRSMSSRERLFLRIERKMLAPPSVNVVIGECMARQLAEWGLGSTCIPLMVSPQAKRLESERARPDVAPLTLFYGGYAGPRSGLSQLFHALSVLPSKDVQLTLVGAGPDFDAIASGRLMPPSNVQVLGRVSDDDYRRLSAGSDVHVVCLDGRATGTSVPSKTYGAMAMGKPVLYIGDASGQAAIDVASAHAGLIARPDSEEIQRAVAELRSFSTSRMRAMGSAGRTYVSECRSPERIGDQWDDLLQGRKRTAAASGL